VLTASPGGISSHSVTISEIRGRIAFRIIALAMDTLILYGIVAGRRKTD
jgi:hypothetical protein